jgi:hypothetical protein
MILKHEMKVDNNQWKVEDDASEHRFTAEISTRTELALRGTRATALRNAEWMMACRF